MSVAMVRAAVAVAVLAIPTSLAARRPDPFQGAHAPGDLSSPVARPSGPAGIGKLLRLHFESKRAARIAAEVGDLGWRGSAGVAAALPHGGADPSWAGAAVSEWAALAALERFSNVASSEDERAAASRQLQRWIPRMLQEDTDDFGDMSNQRLGFWEQLASVLLDVMLRGEVVETWAKVIEHKDTGEEVASVDTSYFALETVRAKAHAAFLFLRITDAISQLTFDLGAAILFRPLHALGDEFRQEVLALEGDAAGKGDAAIGALLGACVAGEAFGDGDCTRAREQLVAGGDGLPQRVRRHIVGLSVRDLEAFRGSDAAVHLVRSLRRMLPKVAITPGSTDWWAQIHTQLAQSAREPQSLELSEDFIDLLRWIAVRLSDASREWLDTSLAKRSSDAGDADGNA